MWGVPKLPRINPGTALNNAALEGILDPERARELRSWPTAKLWDLEEKHDVDIADTFGPGRIQLEGPLDAFFVLHWKRGETVETTVERIDPAAEPDLLAPILKGAGPFFEGERGERLDGKDAVEAAPYVEALRDVPTYVVRGGVDFALAGDRVLDVLGAKAE